MTTKQKIFYLILTIIAIGLMLAGPERITSLIQTQDATKIPVSVLLAELRRLPLPDNHVVLTAPKSFDKEVATGANIRIEVKSSKARTTAEFEQALSQDGWSVSSRRRIANGEQVTLCKNGMSLVIEPIFHGESVIYYVGLGWTKFKRSPSFCPAT